MKTLTTILAGATLFLASCNTNPKNAQETNGTADSVEYTIRSFYKTSTECQKDTCGAYVKATYPEFKSKDLNDYIDGILTNQSKKEISLEVAADSFLNDYLKFKKEYPESSAGNEWIQSIKVSNQQSDLLGITHENYLFTGGAHGLETIIYYNYLVKEKQTVKIKDIIKEGGYAKLETVAEEIFRKNEKLSPTESLAGNYFFEGDKFSLNDNFLITTEGLLFTYNPYEIKAYAFGSTNLLIPYDRISDIVNPNSILANNIK